MAVGRRRGLGAIPLGGLLFAAGLAACGAWSMPAWCATVAQKAQPAIARHDTVRRYPAFGVVLSVSPGRREFVASIREIPGFMDAMEMPFRVRNPHALDHLRVGEIIDFTLAVGRQRSWAEDIRQHVFDNGEAEAQQAQRLSLLSALNAGGAPRTPLQPGDTVPDFTLTDQTGARVSLSQFRGKVVAITFMYTRCPLPDYCFRLNNNFGNVQRRFAAQMGKNLVLLSITFDPEHDTPSVLARYGRTWRADPKGWHFLTGPLPEIKSVCHEFQLNFWTSMGMITHTLHTVVLDRQGRVVANLEGNQFSARQLGDLIEATLRPSTPQK